MVNRKCQEALPQTRDDGDIGNASGTAPGVHDAHIGGRWDRRHGVPRENSSDRQTKSQE
jgi:hypothetical protein